MSKLAQVVEGKTYKINGVEMVFRSLELDDETAKLLGEESKGDKPTEERMDLIKKLVRRMVKDAVPDATDEELDGCMRVKPLLQLTEVFYEVNGMLDEENISKAQKMKAFIQKHKENQLKNAAQQPPTHKG